MECKMNEELYSKIIDTANKVHQNTIKYGNLIAISDELWERFFDDCWTVKSHDKIDSIPIEHKKYRSIDDLSEFDI